MANFKGITLPDGTTYFPEGSGSVIDTVSVSVDNNTGVPSATGSVSGTTLNLDFKNLKGETGSAGPQGNPGQGVPTGGTAGQVLKKKSGTDYDTEWADDTGGSSTGGGSGEKEWKLIKTINVTESVAKISVDKDNEGNPFSLNDILICGNAVTSENTQLIVVFNGREDILIATTNSFFDTSNKTFFVKYENNGIGFCLNKSSTYNLFNITGSDIGVRLVDFVYGKITSLEMKLQYSTTFDSGEIKIYGR